MTRGRRAAPAALRLVKGRSEGTDSGGRKVLVPKFRRVAPAKPRAMSTLASTHWDFLVRQLTEQEILTPAHGGPLEILCETWARWKEAEGQVRELGVTIQSTLSDGRVELRKNPAVTVSEGARRDYLRMAGEFGLTPSAENRVGKAEANGGEVSPFE